MVCLHVDAESPPTWREEPSLRFSFGGG